MPHIFEMAPFSAAQPTCQTVETTSRFSMNVADEPLAPLMIGKPLSLQLLDDSEFHCSDGKAGFEPCIENLLTFSVVHREIPSNLGDC